MEQESIASTGGKQDLGLSWRAVIGWIVLTLLTGQFLWAPIWNDLLSDWSLTGSVFDVELYLAPGVGFGIGGVFGVLAVMGQLRLLRNKGVPRLPWVLSTIASYSLGGAAASFLNFVVLNGLRADQHRPYEALPPDQVTAITLQTAAVSMAVLGLTIGIAQALPLYRRTRRAVLWPLVTLVSWPLAACAFWILYIGLGGPICQTTDCMFAPSPPTFYSVSSVSWLVSGLLVAVITALAMRYILSAPPRAGRLASS